MEGDKGAVCVTGGTGFVASWLIKSLLQEGYAVRTTVRADSENKRDLSFLTSLPGAAEKLKIMSADLSDPESYNAAIEGCKGACLKSKTVKRVVYTSSASTVMFNGQDVEVVDESFWTDVDIIRENLSPFMRSYMISKTLTETAALEFGTQHGLDVVTVIPSLVVGPFICPKFPGSVRLSLALVLGNQSEYSLLLNASMVHVDDLARAHIFLLEYPEAKGRYNCSSDTISLEKLSEFLGGKYPEFPIPSPESLGEIKGMKWPGVSSKKLLDTGFEFNCGVEEMFDGAIQCCKERGYL
ncbi:hypothetical protein GOBAR_AA02948 [Gossypium barbadense]|uniref:NAD-dependent epimerase/dehydratase domain-containing protein n=1 Tax=Gossypium barbadense TaxID=3634 RepID=A0A2P5YPV7_GOSBA|nr:hypothetical protein GOBAR_AA02948 [Gossypium barbadense]